MTDTSFPVTAITGHDYGLPALHQNGLVTARQNHAVAVQDLAQEDDGQISCICGYIDDDGWTVQCDRCNRWQHQVCYYPEYEDRSLPEDLQHYCVECDPRPFDAESARIRQKVKREDASSEINGVKRAAPKSHKKKVKEPSAYTNGWPLDKSRHDRNSAGPRDQGPPAKRPKTSHRTSDSVASIKGHSRKRNASNVNHRRSLSRSPETPYDWYTEQFIRAYHEDDWVPSDSNLHTSTDVRNALSDWLSAPDDTFLSEHGCDKREILWRWDGTLDAIPNKAQIDIREGRDDRVKDADDNVPTWKWVTVQESIADGAFIGELKGHVGFRHEYINDAGNRWPHLRHPEPFVFFHPRLPVYIDARNEGSELRYVRRSCDPNARLSVLVTDATDYHFCFMATKQIDPGMEIAVPWDTWDSVPALREKHNNLSDRDFDLLSSWVSKVLSNCGPCACALPEESCIMARFDRRGEARNDLEPQTTKSNKVKKKKGPNHVSPLNTTLNSRSGSEVRRVDMEDERSDSHSPSASAGRDSASRDITPNTHYSHATIPEMSERERKKLAKEEEMFKKQAVEQTGKLGKKKRNSGGSSLGTPSAAASKQPGLTTSSRYADAATSKQTGLPSKVGKRTKSNAQKLLAASGPRGIKRPKPEYVDSAVQCDLEGEEEAQRSPPPLPCRPFLSTTQRLLQRCALNNARRKGPAALAEAEKLTKADEKMDMDRSQILNALTNMNTISEQLQPKLEAPNDTEMQDTWPMPPAPVETADQQNEGSPEYLSNGPTESQTASTAATSNNDVAPATSETQFRHPQGLHVQMPPPPLNPFAAALALSPASSTNTPNSVFLQSPLSVTTSNPLCSPAVNAAIGPSPAKKKLSLSDYTRRNKAKDHRDVSGEMKGERESSPASVASGPNATPGSGVDGGKEGADGSAVIDEEREDVKMEDVGDVSSVPASVAAASSPLATAATVAAS